MEIRNERSFSEQVKSLEHPIDGANFSESQERLIAYNKSGLKLANESLAVSGLPFIETLQITDFEVLAHDENEDIEREVHQLYCLQLQKPPPVFVKIKYYYCAI